MVRMLGILTLASVGVFTSGAAGQCGEWDNRFGGPLNMSGARSAVVWDPDGDGPEGTQLVVGGSFTTADGAPANRVAIWNGSEWRPLGGGFNNTVHVVSTWDPDAEGPLPPRLVAGGDFRLADGQAAFYIAAWDPMEPGWQPLGQGFNADVRALTVWDSDGDGPQPGRLVAGGNFVVSGGSSTSHVAVWDGASWLQLGESLDGAIVGNFVFSVTSWDPDGDGPMAPFLVAGGDFTSAGQVEANGIAAWNGHAWQALGTGVVLESGTPAVRTLTTWDPDGPGPTQPLLVAGGDFTAAGGAVANGIARWNGSAWSGFGDGLDGFVYSVISRDPDGSGPSPSQLFAGGEFASSGGAAVERVARWEPSSAAWQPLGAGFEGSTLGLTEWDPEGVGAELSRLVAVGPSTAGGVDVEGVGVWDQSLEEWRSLGAGLNARVEAATLWGADPEHPELRQLVVGGLLTTAGGETANRVARWDGSVWHPLGSGVDLLVYALTTWDPDGPGPEGERVVAGGSFASAGGVQVNRIASWDGASWHGMGGGMNNEVLALATWDPDGDGPVHAELFAGGEFVTAGGVTVNRVARWNAASDTWQSLGPVSHPGLNGTVHALAVWDPDGAGPLLPRLVAGGEFSMAGSIVVNRVAMWDGFQWSALGGGLSGGGPPSAVYALTVWDPDGAGPATAQLVAGGNFTTAGGVSALRIARFDGSTWHAIGGGVSGAVHALAAWDPDAEGPAAAQLIAGGGFISAGGATVNRLARWDPNMPGWQALQGGVNSTIYTITALRLAEHPFSVEQVVIGGMFTLAGGVPAGSVAMWSTLSPEFTEQPQDADVEPGELLSLSVSARNGQPSYQWRRNGEALSNGPTGHGSVISGATAKALGVSNVQPADEGSYDCIVTNSCGEAVSDVAVVVVAVPPMCGGDANGDEVVDGADLSVLLGQFGQSVTPGTAADFNGDGVVDGADLSVLLFRFGTAC